MSHAKISVVIPVYNAEKYLEQCLLSVVNQTLGDIEIICVDDGSTDNSSNILKEYSKEDNRVNIIKQANNGPGVARNTGLKSAKGEYVSFLDSDDFIINLNAFNLLFNIAKEKNAKMVSGNLKNLSSNNLINNNLCTNIKEYKKISPQEYGIPWYFSRNIYERKFLINNSINFPRYFQGEDPVFLAKVLSKLKFIHQLPIDFYAYRYILSGKTKKDSRDKQIEYIKHYIDVFDILKENKFKNVRLQYLGILYEFLYKQRQIFGERIVENYIKEAAGNKDLLIRLCNL